MQQNSDVFVGVDVAKARYAVAIAENGKSGQGKSDFWAKSTPIRYRSAAWSRGSRSGTQSCISVTKQVRPDMGCIAS